MTTQEAAASLGIGPSHVRRLILQGKLNARKQGRDWWIEPAALEEVRQRPRVGYPKGRPRSSRELTTP
jgi:excisionase family DNA binding protein